MKTNITEVRSDYYNTEERCYYIDAWVDDNDEGFSVAKVYDNPLKIECQPGREDYFSDPIVQGEIVSVIKEIFSIK